MVSQMTEVLKTNFNAFVFCSMDEEIKIERQNELLMVASIFPNARDFHFLLCNKFET